MCKSTSPAKNFLKKCLLQKHFITDVVLYVQTKLNSNNFKNYNYEI